jgi:hypothetical protein
VGPFSVQGQPVAYCTWTDRENSTVSREMSSKPRMVTAAIP